MANSPGSGHSWRMSLESRRGVLKQLALAAGWVTLGTARHSEAAEAPHLDVKDPAAVAVGYVEDAAQADAKKHPSFDKSQNCENCLQLQGKEGAPYRPCTLFPGKLVAAKGWCSGWTAEI
jgi:High potential iron-sulfur protein